MYENPYMRQYTPYQPAQNGIQWVQGEAGAKSFMVAPNNSILLMDSEESKFYIKSADVSGMPTLRIFEYTEISPVKGEISPAAVKVEDYCTKDELEEIRQQIKDLAARIETNTAAPKTTRKKEVVENE